jgi:predicted membrane metal-binding protein
LRILLQVVLPFLAPFVVYGLYLLLVTRGRPVLVRTPWFLLTAAGLILACAALASLAFISGEPPAGRYVPSRVEDGRIVPGEVIPQ